MLGPLAILGMLRGMENLFVDMLTDPDEVKKALETITYTLKQFAEEFIKAGCCAVMFDTLFAAQSIMSKSMWDEFEGPLVEDLGNHIRSVGGMTIVHNCGSGVYFDVQIDTYKKSDRFVLATGCEYPAPLDFTKAKIMVEEACTYGKY